MSRAIAKNFHPQWRAAGSWKIGCEHRFVVLTTKTPRHQKSPFLFLEVAVEPVERIGLHLTIKLVTPGIKLRAVHLRRASTLESLTQHLIGTLHFCHGVEGI